MSGILHAKVESATGKDMADWTQAKHIADVLDRHYPGHMWAVHVDSVGGIATVKNLRLSGTWGFCLKLVDTFSQSEWDKRIMLAGGELLERYRLHAGRFIQSQYDGLKRENGQHVASL